ncbi:hypothetical protein LSTR_LSTR006347 [Laodelphax striatellus]|uniref:Uncharacterized protein n=1 Tax=Laodelphax striatellus TaxID=195883 RepID=A0A482XDD5_LAOST|nr:hypothetical protein LSTR_LSTR006347 [Laodelphax striatellus]
MSGVLETEKEILQELLHLDSSDEEEDNILEEDSGDEDYNSDADQEYFLDRPSGLMVKNCGNRWLTQGTPDLEGDELFNDNMSRMVSVYYLTFGESLLRGQPEADSYTRVCFELCVPFLPNNHYLEQELAITKIQIILRCKEKPLNSEGYVGKNPYYGYGGNRTPVAQAHYKNCFAVAREIAVCILNEKTLQAYGGTTGGYADNFIIDKWIRDAENAANADLNDAEMIASHTFLDALNDDLARGDEDDNKEGEAVGGGA